MDHVQAFLLCPSPLFTLDGFYRYHQEKKNLFKHLPRCYCRLHERKQILPNTIRYELTQNPLCTFFKRLNLYGTE